MGGGPVGVHSRAWQGVPAVLEACFNESNWSRENGASSGDLALLCAGVSQQVLALAPPGLLAQMPGAVTCLALGQ